MPRRAKPKFRETERSYTNKQMVGSNEMSLVDYQRLAAKTQLPGGNPFWTRHAATSGLAYLDFDSNAAQGTIDGVDIDVADGHYNFGKSPLMLAWFRYSAADLTYSEKTEIFRYPNQINGGHFEQFIDARSKVLRFTRRSITPSGTPTPSRVYIKFLIFDDEPFVNVTTGAVA